MNSCWALPCAAGCAVRETTKQTRQSHTHHKHPVKMRAADAQPQTCPWAGLGSGGPCPPAPAPQTPLGLVGGRAYVTPSTAAMSAEPGNPSRPALGTPRGPHAPRTLPLPERLSPALSASDPPLPEVLLVPSGRSGPCRSDPESSQSRRPQEHLLEPPGWSAR